PSLRVFPTRENRRLFPTVDPSIQTVIINIRVEAVWEAGKAVRSESVHLRLLA
ncbi:MAG: hypothetical protein Q9224_002868, partial [Gallowayella concinna]